MCYSAIYDRQVTDLYSHFDLPGNLPPLPEKRRFFPRGNTFVIARSKQLGQPTLREMQYYLIPPWSKDAKYTGSHSSYNARLEKNAGGTEGIIPIYQNGLWNKFFGTHHCVVPITGFYEICRIPGSLAEDHEVRFHSKNILFAAGIYSWWTSKDQSFNSFAMITTNPSPYIKMVGHERSPLFLKPENANRWLGDYDDSKQAYDFLENHTHNPTLTFEKIRKVKKPSPQ